MRDPKPSTLSRRGWLAGALTLACSRVNEAPTGASAEPQPPARTGSGARASQAPKLEPTPGIAVVELFTSQGCSSCPPADRVLSELTEARDPALLTLSFHVDYWNYLGWADPYSSPRYSARQRVYASRLTGGRVFTPQVVVNGRHSALGSAEDEIEDLIRMEKKLATEAQVELQFDDATLRYRAKAPQGPDSKITLLVLQDSVHNAVPRGENTGEDLSHVHVVRDLYEHALEVRGSEGATGEWKPDLARLPHESLSAAALISDRSGAIVGAQLITLG